MRTKSILPLLLLLIAPSSIAQAVLDAEGSVSRVDVPGDRGAVSIEARGLPTNVPLRAFVTTRSPWTTVSAERPSNPGDSFFQLPMFSKPIDGWGAGYMTVGTFIARAVDDSSVELRVRSDSGRVYCQHRSIGGVSRCILRIPHSEIPQDPITGRQRMTLSVQAEARGPRDVQVAVSGFVSEAVSPGNALELQSAVTTGPSGTVTLTMPYTVRQNRADVPEAFQVALRDDAGTTYREGTVLVNRDRREPSASIAIVGGDTDDDLGAGSSHADIVEHRKLVFLVPGNAGRIDFRASTSATFPVGTTHPDGTPQDLELSLHRWSRDPSLSDVLALPAGQPAQYIIDKNGAAPWPRTASEALSLDGQSMAPGLWYVVPRSKTGVPLNVQLSVEFGPAPRTLVPETGHYFNPARAGHGFILAPAGNDWVLIWYTFDESGKPVWYYAQGPKPNRHSGGSQWMASLYRNVWDGEKTRFQFAGIVQIAALSTDRLTFVHMLNGRVGAEDMQRLGDGRCAQRLGNAPLDVNGLWFSPTKSGYGYSVEFIGGTEFYLAYAYDANGMPRWVTAQQTDAATRMPLAQVRGPCSSCAPALTSREIIGTFDRTIGTDAAPDNRAGFLTLGLDANFVDGVPGRWRENRPVALLSQRAGCAAD